MKTDLLSSKETQLQQLINIHISESDEFTNIEFHPVKNKSRYIYKTTANSEIVSELTGFGGLDFELVEDFFNNLDVEIVEILSMSNFTEDMQLEIVIDDVISDSRDYFLQLNILYKYKKSSNKLTRSHYSIIGDTYYNRFNHISGGNKTYDKGVVVNFADVLKK